MIFNVPFTDVTKADIDQLIANQVPESVTLDYKREFDKKKGKIDGREFLFDVTAFNNTQGGLLIFGVEEKKDNNFKNTGLPARVVPLIDNVDQLTQRLENILRTGTQPALTSVQMRFVPYDGGNVLVLQVPPNFGTPRMVTHGGTNKFYRRTAGGKYLPDVYELEEMFMQGANRREKAMSFHRKRLKRMKKEDTLVLPGQGTSIVLHAVPLDGARTDTFDFGQQETRTSVGDVLNSLVPDGEQLCLNVEGVVVKSQYSWNGVRSEYVTEYAQLFQNGGLEFYSSKPFVYLPKQGDHAFNFGYTKERISEVVRGVQKLADFAAARRPHLLAMTIRGVKHFPMMLSGDNPRRFHFDRNTLRFPPVLVQNLKGEEAIDSLLSLLYQAAGLTR